MNQYYEDLIIVLQRKIEIKRQKIKKNQKIIESILKNELASLSRFENIDSIYEKNKRLHEENEVMINLHNEILKFLNETKDMKRRQLSHSKADKQNKSNRSEYGNKLEDNQCHEETPFDYFEAILHEENSYFCKILLDDQQFYQKLINYYIQNEDYELCDKILNLKQQLDK